MKVIVGAAFALGLVLGGGQTLATQLVADDVSSVDEPAPDADDSTDATDETNETDDPGDTDAAESTEPTEPTEDGDGPAEVSYGQLVKTWLVCQGGEDTTACGTRPHPPGVATGFDAAHAKDHTTHGKQAQLKPEHVKPRHDAHH